MAVKKAAQIGVAVVSLVASFWAGSAFQKSEYADRCLDLGGGRNPGQHPICVIEKHSAALRLGPIGVANKDIVEVAVRYEPGEQALVHLKLRPEIASALTAFTAASVGQNLDIWVDGELVNSVNIAEAVKGDQFILALAKPQAEKLAELLGANVE